MRFSNAESRKGIVGWGLKRKEPWGGYGDSGVPLCHAFFHLVDLVVGLGEEFQTSAAADLKGEILAVSLHDSCGGC